MRLIDADALKTKAIIEHFYNDHDIVIAIAEMERCEGWEVSE